ncbi:Cytochrome P450 4V2 [Eumeta japonica]|uniref:Cytochrome P450 4V2 n=1 Tax=Eumeta variegata TaxID=151549 RepID=A0A4C1V3K9_EUMVA|nr:Cytochrome P450 4V2 [Eumeta japonica]
MSSSLLRAGDIPFYLRKISEISRQIKSQLTTTLCRREGVTLHSARSTAGGHALRAVIRNKKEEIEKGEQEIHTKTQTEFDVNLYTKKTFLELLISLSGGAKGYSNIELREEVMTIIIAGTDTSAVALGFTLMLLAKYPDVQERVHKELYDVFGTSYRPLVKEDLPKLQYLERVIKESLRLFPPVPFIIRKILEEIELPSGRILPAGCGVAISIWGVHRDPAHWGPDAEHFDPDRFSPERFLLEHPCSYMPFSSGPRNCLGYRYAMMSLKTVLATLLRRCRVLGEPERGPVPHIDVKIDIMMKATNGYKISIAKRQ